MSFPEIRMRQRRKDEAARKSCRQAPELSLEDLIMPLFVREGIIKKREVKSMPGIYQFSLKEAQGQAQRIYESGIPAVILFGIPREKDAFGSSAFAAQGIIQQAIGAIKKRTPNVCIIADVCMCEYTAHGHCGIIKEEGGQFTVDNDATIEILAKIAVSYARAGADIVAPSAMMDGQVKAIKEALVKNNLTRAKIMSYSAKYASCFYGPFREAALSSPQFGDRKTYQMDYANADEAVLEAKLDVEEGADIIMVKPALGYQDIIYRLKSELNFPTACYSVSGEYSMLKLASAQGYFEEKKTVLEMLSGFKRSGADLIISYYAAEAAGWLRN